MPVTFSQAKFMPRVSYPGLNQKDAMEGRFLSGPNIRLAIGRWEGKKPDFIGIATGFDFRMIKQRASRNNPLLPVSFDCTEGQGLSSSDPVAIFGSL